MNKVLLPLVFSVIALSLIGYQEAFAVIDEFGSTDEVLPMGPLDTREETHSYNAVNLISNGDFETGDFTDWTLFLTANGVTNPNVALFDTDGDLTATQSAQFNVGQVIFEGFGNTNFRGGGILQTITTGGGTVIISADIASDNLLVGNLDGGQFKLFFNGVEVDSHSFGFIAADTTLRSTLNAQINGVAAGTYEVKIEIGRTFATDSTTPLQYVDNVIVEDDSLAIGGKLLPLDTTALLLAGVQSVSMWMIPVVLSGIGIGVFVTMRSRK